MDKNKDGMHQIHDVKIIERVGREKQRYDENHNRLCAGTIPIRGDKILLLTTKDQSKWCFPKGGWETDETLEEAARRETREEAGVDGQIIASLGRKVHIGHSYKQNTWELFLLKADTVYDDYPDVNYRKREWYTPEYALENLTLVETCRDFLVEYIEWKKKNPQQ